MPLTVQSKGEAIWELIQTVHSAGFIENPGDVLDRILERERQGGTTLGEGISILHCKLPYLERPAIVLGVLPPDHDIAFGDTLDIPVDIIYLVLSPSERPELHLQVLASIATFLSNAEMRTRLRHAKNAKEAMKIIQEHPGSNEAQPT